MTSLQRSRQTSLIGPTREKIRTHNRSGPHEACLGFLEHEAGGVWIRVLIGPTHGGCPPGLTLEGYELQGARVSQAVP